MLRHLRAGKQDKQSCAIQRYAGSGMPKSADMTHLEIGVAMFTAAAEGRVPCFEPAGKGCLNLEQALMVVIECAC